MSLNLKHSQTPWATQSCKLDRSSRLEASTTHEDKVAPEPWAGLCLVQGLIFGLKGILDTPSSKSTSRTSWASQSCQEFGKREEGPGDSKLFGFKISNRLARHNSLHYCMGISNQVCGCLFACLRSLFACLIVSEKIWFWLSVPKYFRMHLSTLSKFYWSQISNSSNGITLGFSSTGIWAFWK